MQQPKSCYTRGMRPRRRGTHKTSHYDYVVIGRAWYTNDVSNTSGSVSPVEIVCKRAVREKLRYPPGQQPNDIGQRDPPSSRY